VLENNGPSCDSEQDGRRTEYIEWNVRKGVCFGPLLSGWSDTIGYAELVRVCIGYSIPLFM